MQQVPLQLPSPAHWVSAREGETKVGQAIHLLPVEGDYQQQINDAWQQGRRIAVLGIPESIGVKGNLGRAGAELGWQAFLQSFLNLQATGIIPLDELLLVGAVDCDDIQQQAEALDPNEQTELNRIRELCGIVDGRVKAVVEPLFEAGFEVIAIGGGHNNAYPLLTALAQATGQSCGAVNLDPHADFRPREGRHSGNGFSYAYTEGALSAYHVLGLHEAKNSVQSLRQMFDAGVRYDAVHQLLTEGFANALDSTMSRAVSWQRPLAIEVDVDAISQAPASAMNYTGVTFADAFSYVSRLAEVAEARYLHLAEAAPGLHPAGEAEGRRACGQLLSELVLAYFQGRRQR
ncbi:arginase [Idiomarina tyrosinivorans]|uniref:Arginase n=1 Tax=Idiomarina tyrosinivorans TaxID=1445662 RepID=A0A432ZQ20_9GAMM|nr:formimidoylglutamase [Idiomarina tyrosinivorans]RUO79928.1 arginase [Idiomarina tyrosinivorans]